MKTNRTENVEIPETFASKEEERNFYETQASQAQFEAWYKKEEAKEYPAPFVTADGVLIKYDVETKSPMILLIKRGHQPFQGKWAIPGGFLDEQEAANLAIQRELMEETGLSVPLSNIEQLETVTTPHRDPRGWIITVAHLVFVPNQDKQIAKASDDAVEARWFRLERNKAGKVDLLHTDGRVLLENEIAFDHKDILDTAIQRVGNKLDYQPDVLKILPIPFTLRQARDLFKVFNDEYKDMSISNFKTNRGKYLKSTPERITAGRGKPSVGYVYKD